MKRISLIGLCFAAASVISLAFLAYTPDLDKEVLKLKYATSASRFVALPDGSVAHVRVEGNRAGLPLVLIHGSNASLQTWEPWVRRLNDSFELITFDLPGHGLTGTVPNSDYSPDGMVAFVREILEMLDIHQYAIAGSSMGGEVALQYAELYPQNVTALILIDAGGLPPKANEETDRPLAFKIARIPLLNQIIRWILPKQMIAEALKKTFADPANVTPAMIERYYDLSLCCGNRLATILRFGLPRNTEQLGARLGEIRAPTLILWGRQDRFIPVSHAQEFATRVRGAESVIYEGVGHLPMEEIPEKSAKDVQAFLARVTH